MRSSETTSNKAGTEKWAAPGAFTHVVLAAGAASTEPLGQPQPSSASATPAEQPANETKGNVIDGQDAAAEPTIEQMVATLAEPTRQLGPAD